MRSKLILIPLLVVLLLVTSCLNSIERRLIGRYNVYELELKDTSSNRKINLSLELRKNKSFSLYQDKEIISGNWRAGDNGDMTWVDLHFDNKKAQCRVLGMKDEIIKIWIPEILFDSSIFKLSFIRE